MSYEEATKHAEEILDQDYPRETLIKRIAGIIWQAANSNYEVPSHPPK